MARFSALRSWAGGLVRDEALLGTRSGAPPVGAPPRCGGFGARGVEVACIELVATRPVLAAAATGLLGLSHDHGRWLEELSPDSGRDGGSG